MRDLPNLSRGLLRAIVEWVYNPDPIVLVTHSRRFLTHPGSAQGLAGWFGMTIEERYWTKKARAKVRAGALLLLPFLSLTH